MTAPYLQGSAAVPEETAIYLRGAQTDAYGEIRGGHRFLFDPLQSGIADRPAAGAALPNLVTGRPDATFTSWASAPKTVAEAKGIPFWDATTEYVALPFDEADLMNLGDTPSFVMSIWITNDMVTATGYPAIAGYAYQTSTAHQWSFSYNPSGNTIQIQVDPSTTGRVQVAVPLSTPTLLTIHMNKVSETTATMNVYRGTELVGSGSVAYPFVDAAGLNSTASRRMGIITGFGAGWVGTVHRFQLFKVPQDFDVASWLATEVALNAPRFAA